MAFTPHFIKPRLKSCTPLVRNLGRCAGFTLIEILVSTVLISLVLVGLGNLFLGGKKWMQHRRYQITAGQIAKVFLDPLQMDVRQDQWGSNCLSSGIGCPGTQNVDGITYTPVYNISAVGNLRRVQLTISWSEPTS
ncbi:MAG: prepilin-type N-terminal cleavage/methylation domain-containing protein [Candidatus Omnitrophota bacterium]